MTNPKVKFTLPLRHVPTGSLLATDESNPLLRSFFEAFGVRSEKLKQIARKNQFGNLTIICTPGQFGNFILLRNKYGAENWVKELNADILDGKSLNISTTLLDVSEAGLIAESSTGAKVHESGAWTGNASRVADKPNPSDPWVCEWERMRASGVPDYQIDAYRRVWFAGGGLYDSKSWTTDRRYFYGVDLGKTEARAVCWYMTNPPWTPGVVTQCIDRTKRHNDDLEKRAKECDKCAADRYKSRDRSCVEGSSLYRHVTAQAKRWEKRAADFRAQKTPPHPIIVMDFETCAPKVDAYVNRASEFKKVAEDTREATLEEVAQTFDKRAKAVEEDMASRGPVSYTMRHSGLRYISGLKSNAKRIRAMKVNPAPNVASNLGYSLDFMNKEKDHSRQEGVQTGRAEAQRKLMQEYNSRAFMLRHKADKMAPADKEQRQHRKALWAEAETLTKLAVELKAKL